MIFEQAEALLAETLAPLSTDEFFDAVGKASLDAKGNSAHPRRQLFGDDPKSTLLAGFRTHSGRLEHHAKSPTQPAPAPRDVASAEEFLALIRSFHERGYTVVVPDVVPLAPLLQRFARALEYMLHQPVSASLFWSAAGAQAIVHYDKRDNIIVQLAGEKRWYISTDAPGLQNKWKQVGEPLPDLQRRRIVDVAPGDLIYIPRGTPHTVESTTESLHLAILFEPITMRDAIIAAVDHLSDGDRMFRETAVRRASEVDFRSLSGGVIDGVERLLTHCRSEDFLKAAMDLRASRMTADLPPLARPLAPPSVTRDTRVRQSPLAIAHLRPSFSSLDVSQPGEHIAVHPGVARELEFIVSTPAFRVADIPGAAGDDVKAALVKRFIDSGFLEIAD
jgi:bifunctional lysine-specific demethylase and histidyl-hydroxylase MINA